MSNHLRPPLGPVIHVPGEAWRRATALLLRMASRMLARLARRLANKLRQPASSGAPELEFYADAGAPEGALYLDGELVGHIPGVYRL